ncbi:RagB/SusD family nutrient uptake outer membrane protein [Butyricimonas virosa]|uniref:RagB/SusD family nutrient uptake outer membrane protein n=1 Tax=Butyricimonas virosa TaxID=544645 RepID=UPI003D04D5BA
MKRFCKYICLIVLIACVSCGDFLEEYSQDLTYAKTAADLDEILVGEGYMPVASKSAMTSLDGEYYFPWLHVLDDDMKEHVYYANATRNSLSAFYTWAPYPYTNEKNEVVKDNTWERLYKHISVINVVLEKSKDVTGTPEDIARIQGECYFLRAMYYYYLVNFYAKPYSKETADTDLGVPVKTTEYIEDKYFSRNTIAEVYTQMLNDLREAKRLLKGKEKKTIYRANYYAVQAFLSRVYLYMEEYEQVVAAADTVLSASYGLLDYNGLTLSTNSWGQVVPVSTTYRDSPETIFSQGGNAIIQMMSGDYFQISDNLIELFRQNMNDLRLKFCIYEAQYYGAYYKSCKLVDKEDGMVSSNSLIRLPEVVLNKAEALALLGKDQEARGELEKLRIKRMVTANYQPVNYSGSDLIDFIRDERRRELCFEGHRWFDLRRYAVNVCHPFTTEILHDKYEISESSGWSAAYQGTYRLKTYSETPASYVLPIPQHVIEFNRGEMKDNDARPEIEVFNNK